MKKPPLVFSPLPGRTDFWNERGIDRWGPYDQRSFTPRRPRITVVCRAETQGEVEQFVRKFLDGLPDITVGSGQWAALVQIDDAFHALEGDENSYLVTNAAFMKRHVPVQEVTIEKMRSPASDLVYILNDISLASYAKMGGTPWLLSADVPLAHELVIGLGSHRLSRSRLGTANAWLA